MSDRFEAPRFAIETDREGGVATVAVVGELDLATGPRLEAALDAVDPGYERLVIDLSRCSFFSSVGIRIVLDENDRAARDGFELVIVKAPPDVQRVFDLTNLDQTLRFQDSD